MECLEGSSWANWGDVVFMYIGVVYMHLNG